MFLPRIYIVNVYPMNAVNIYNSDFLDILFEGRNKDYGAYELRKSEDRRVRNAILGTASFALVVISGYVISNQLKAADMGIRKEVIIPPATITDLPRDPELTPPPPPVQSTPPPANSSIKSVTPTITEDDKVRPEDEVPRMDSIGNKSIGLATIQGDDVNGVDAGTLLGEAGNKVVEGPKAEDRETIRTFVDIMPSYPGGEGALMKYLHDNTKYPQMAIENGVEGKIFVQFVVDWEGNIRDVQTTGAHKGAGLEEEAMRVVKKMPRWKPGKQNGQAVTVRFNLPISFSIQ